MSAPYRTYPVAETIIDAPVSEFFARLAALEILNVSMQLPQVPPTARMTATAVGYDPKLFELAVHEADEECMVCVGWLRLA